MIIGREKQRQELLGLLKSDESKFCAVYGRRRVGKTFIVNETLKGEFSFVHTGLSKASKREQISEFCESLFRFGLKRQRVPGTWYAAFHLLEDFLAGVNKEKKVVFIDELPWLDTPKSSFLSAFEHFWNGWAALRGDIVLIVCGSATSWIIKNLFSNHGGLHDRITNKIHLQPFSLNECEQYASNMGLALSRKDLTEAYMIMGGIPYYWGYLRAGESLAQNIDRMFFSADAPLQGEFEALYRSLFKSPAIYMNIVEALAKRRSGLLREEILSITKAEDNEVFQKALKELEQCGFLRKYTMLGYKSKNALYQLIDNFTLFHFQFIATKGSHSTNLWSDSQFTPAHNAWAGLAFERVCLQHISQIKGALGIQGVSSQVYSWTYRPKEADSVGAFQIDLLLDRSDRIINICEMKFTDDEYSMSAADDKALRQRIARFTEQTGTRKAIHPVLVTTYGISNSGYRSVFQRIITLDQLFAV